MPSTEVRLLMASRRWRTPVVLGLAAGVALVVGVTTESLAWAVISMVVLAVLMWLWGYALLTFGLVVSIRRMHRLRAR